MVAASDVLLTLGCVWSASRGHAPDPVVQHVDLWWQPAASLEAARDACLSARGVCTGVYWNQNDGVYKMLSGAVTSAAAPPQLRDSHSVHTHACSVDEFRRKLARSRDNVIFVVTTVPRTRPGAKNRDGTSYFSSHLDSVLSQARGVGGEGEKAKGGGGRDVGGAYRRPSIPRRCCRPVLASPTASAYANTPPPHTHSRHFLAAVVRLDHGLIDIFLFCELFASRGERTNAPCEQDLPVIYVQGNPRESEEADQIIGAAHKRRGREGGDLGANRHTRRPPR